MFQYLKKLLYNYWNVPVVIPELKNYTDEEKIDFVNQMLNQVEKDNIIKKAKFDKDVKYQKMRKEIKEYIETTYYRGNELMLLKSINLCIEEYLKSEEEYKDTYKKYDRCELKLKG